jgi:hypothetical protein
MGYWNSTADGQSLQPNDTGIIWGDEPADIIGDALDEIAAVFMREWGREPTEAEWMAGLKFSLGGRQLGQYN